MDEFNQLLFEQLLYGIPLDAWQRFFKVFTEDPKPTAVENLLKTLKRERGEDPSAILKTAKQADQLHELLQDMADFFRQS
jgi:hypothetical protein